LLQGIRQNDHRVVVKLAPHRQWRLWRLVSDRRRLHVHAEQAFLAIGRQDRHGMAMAYHRLRGHDEAGEISEILGRRGNNGIQSFGAKDTGNLIGDDFAHLESSSQSVTAYFSTLASSTSIPIP